VTGEALAISLRVTAVAAVLVFIIGLGLARLFARREFTGKTTLETLILLPIVLPPSVVGYYLLLALGANGPLGRFAGLRVLFTWQAAVVAATVVGVPLMYTAAKAAIAGVNPALENAARVLGASEFGVFFRVTLPLAGRGLLAGAVLGTARAFGEFGATLMVAGNIPGRTQTLPIAIYDAVQAGRYDAANRMVLLMTIIAFVSLWIVRRFERASRDTTRGLPADAAQ
jgi:molybdate transport system permease protein